MRPLFAWLAGTALVSSSMILARGCGGCGGTSELEKFPILTKPIDPKEISPVPPKRKTQLKKPAKSR
jgi:hypothetical protein